jgi:hypothetical protein
MTSHQINAIKFEKKYMYKLIMVNPSDAYSCQGWDCTVEKQFCPPNAPGSGGKGYCCIDKKWKQGTCSSYADNCTDCTSDRDYYWCNIDNKCYKHDSEGPCRPSNKYCITSSSNPVGCNCTACGDQTCQNVANKLFKNGWNDTYIIDNSCSQLTNATGTKASCEKILQEKGTKYGAYTNTATRSQCLSCESNAIFKIPSGEKGEQLYSIWKKPINVFPKTRDLVYTKDTAEAICKSYNLKLCSSDDIQYNQDCAPGWTSDKTTPISWMNEKIVDCGNYGYNSFKGQGVAYCCGELDSNMYNTCTNNYPYPFKGSIVGHGGTFDQPNNFCCSTENECLLNSSETTALSITKDNDSGLVMPSTAIPCPNPPCKKYIDNTTISEKDISECKKILDNGSTTELFVNKDIFKCKNNKIIYIILGFIIIILVCLFVVYLKINKYN